MSLSGTIRDNLERIFEMMPLSEREKELADMQISCEELGCGIDIEPDELEWWGEKATIAHKHVYGNAE